MSIDEALTAVKGGFSYLAEFQGLHFKYVVKNGVVLLETRRNAAELAACPTCGANRDRDMRYYYWLLVDGRFKLIHASRVSRLKRMEPVTDSTLVPSSAYNT